MEHHRFGYRPDIEGLRAIAILLVVAAHAKLPALAGGFVGVDVFFVLSGYLITSLLIREIRSTGSLRLTDFYLRRLRRLLPALLLMLGVSSLSGWLLLAPFEQPDQASAAASAALWLSNFHFALARMDYFAPGSESNLFLHTWSLGVEEQFYLCWPLMLLAVMDARTDTQRLQRALVAVFILSLTLSVWWTWHAPQLAFYMMPSRAWQFALGALASLIAGTGVASRGWTAMGWLGLALILAAALRLNHGVPYPGVWALLPALGAAFLLACGQRTPDTGPSRLLAARPMQALGRVSYAWYLWHWPILLLGATLIDAGSGWNRAALALLSLLIAGASYLWVERPIRQAPRLLTRPRMTLFAALALMIVAGSFALRWHTAALVHMNSPEQLRYLQVRGDLPAIYGMGCDDWYRSARVRVCAFGAKSARHTVAIIGDSVGLQWFPAYARIFDSPDWRLLVVTKSSCPMVDVPIFYERIGREYTECTQWRSDAMQEVASLKPDIVILGATDTYDFSAAEWTEGTRRILQTLHGKASRIYLVRSTPTLPFDGPSCLARRSPLRDALRHNDECAAPLQDARSRQVFSWLKAAARAFTEVHVIDMTENICPQGTCHAERDGHIVFRDNRHLSASFVESLVPTLEGKLQIANDHDNVKLE